MKKLRLILALCTFALILKPVAASAYFSTFDTNNTLDSGQYKLGLEGQYIFNTLQGGNLVAHYAMGLGDGQELKFLVGSGITNLQLGGFYKFVPIPDTDNQPAVGGFVGVIYSSINGQSLMNFRFHPMISKNFKFNDDHSTITPYASIPIGISVGNGSTLVPVQLALGAEWLPPFMENMRIITEIGFNITNAFSYFSAGLSVPFESFDTLKLK